MFRVALLVAGCLMAFAMGVDDWKPIDPDEYGDYEKAIQKCAKRMELEQPAKITGGIELSYPGFNLSAVNYESVKNQQCMMFWESLEDPYCDTAMTAICDITSNKGKPMWKDLERKNFQSILKFMNIGLGWEAPCKPARIVSGKEAEMITGSGTEKAMIIMYESSNSDSCFAYLREEMHARFSIYSCEGLSRIRFSMSMEGTPLFQTPAEGKHAKQGRSHPRC